MIKCTHFKWGSMSLTNIFTGVTNTAIEISNVSITLKSSFMVPAIHPHAPSHTHTSDLWQSLVFFSVAIAYLGVSHKWNHSVLDDLMLLRILVHSFLQQIGIPFLWLCHKVYPFLLLNFKRTVLSYRQVGQRKVKTRVNRKIFIIDVIIS